MNLLRFIARNVFVLCFWTAAILAAQTSSRSAEAKTSNGVPQPFNEEKVAQESAPSARPNPPARIPDVMGAIANIKGPFRGNPDAKVTVVLFDDYQCPYCGYMYKAVFGDVLKEYGDRVRFVLRDVPNSTIHPWAKRAAINARCVASQSTEAYWVFSDRVHADQQHFNSSFAEQLDSLALDAARDAKADADLLRNCLNAQPAEAIAIGYADAKALDVSAVPTIYVNEEKVFGAVDVRILREAVDRALKKAGVTASGSGASSDPIRKQG